MNKSASTSRFLLWVTVILLGALATGCGGGDGRDPILGGGVAILAPTVISTVPIAATPIVSGVATNSRITATFSTDMTGATISAASFTLACPAATAIDGTVSYDAASRTARFSPTAPLPVGITCTATITTGAQDTAGVALVNAFIWQFTTGATADTRRPTVTLTVPADTATGVATNTKITATFSEAMEPATITASSFTVTGPGSTVIAGTVSYAVAARSVTFTPTTPTTLPTGTLFTATITTAATDVAGNALAGNQGVLPAPSDYIWTFTTGAAADTTAPTVTLLSPADLATDVCFDKPVTATFSEAMDPATFTATTFTLQPTGASVLGASTTYDAPSKVASLTPTSALVANTNYTATLTTGVTDLAGNALATDTVWTFTTAAAACSSISPVALGAAAPFGNLGGTAGTTNEGTLTVIDGDIGTTATATSAVTGFHDAADIYTETPANSGTVNGTMYTCTISTTGPTSVVPNPTACGIATQALGDAQTAYNNLSPASLPGGTDPGAGQLGGLTLAPGVYQAAGGSFLITGSDLTLDGQGDTGAVWVFQTASTLTVGAPAAPRSIILINGAQAKNVFWQVGTSATINGAGGGTMVGTIIASSAVSFSTSGNVAIVTLNGRAVGLNASVTMTNTVINVPAP